MKRSLLLVAIALVGCSKPPAPPEPPAPPTPPSQSSGAPGEPPPPPPPPKPPGASNSRPYGVPVAGQPGFVTSPFAPTAGAIDVRGFPPSTEVKDPYTGKIFLVP